MCAHKPLEREIGPHVCCNTKYSIQKGHQEDICTTVRANKPNERARGSTSRKRGFQTPPLVAEIFEPRLKGSLVAVREATRDRRSGPSGLGRQLADGRGFSRGWPGQPRLKVLRPGPKAFSRGWPGQPGLKAHPYKCGSPHFT